MRVGTVAWMLMIVALAGCADDGGAPAPALMPLEDYRFAYPGSDTAVEGVDHGWMVRVSNPSDVAYRATLVARGIETGVLGPISLTAGNSPQDVFLPVRIEAGGPAAAPTIDLEPGEAGLFIVQVEAYQAGVEEAGYRIHAAPVAAPTELASGPARNWPIDVIPAAEAVGAGDHVRTVTVGVWTNGTSFYTNEATLLADPAFPAGFARDAFGTDPLSIYVYDNDRSEQPAASQDGCWGTTIRGYNALLKQQAAGSTGVRLLQPEAAYTIEGAEDHPLYGDALVFLNTVVSHEGANGPLDELPDPTGACFSDRLDDLPIPPLGQIPLRP